MTQVLRQYALVVLFVPSAFPGGGLDAKAWGVEWERDLSSDAGIDMDSDSEARKNVRVPRVGPRAGGAFVLKPNLPLPHPAQPTPFLLLDNLTPERAFLDKNYDETPDALIVTRAACPAPPQTHPQRLMQASWAHWARRHSRFQLPSVC